jgi:hypothetical protein
LKRLGHGRGFSGQSPVWSMKAYMMTWSGYCDRQIRWNFNPHTPTETCICPPFLPLSAWLDRSARCPGTLSSLWPSQGRFPVSFGPWRTTCDSRLRACTAYPVNVVKSTLGKLAVQMKPGSRSNNHTFVWNIQINQLWLYTA